MRRFLWRVAGLSLILHSEKRATATNESSPAVKEQLRHFWSYRATPAEFMLLAINCPQGIWNICERMPTDTRSNSAPLSFHPSKTHPGLFESAFNIPAVCFGFVRLGHLTDSFRPINVASTEPNRNSHRPCGCPKLKDEEQTVNLAVSLCDVSVYKSV